MAVAGETTPVRAARVRAHRRVDRIHLGLWIATGLVAMFLLAPIAIIFLTSFNEARTVDFPPRRFSLVWYGLLVDTLKGAPGTRSGLASSIWFSAYLALIVAAISTLGGVLAALALHKFVFRGKEAFHNIFLFPLVFPSLVVGVGLLLTFSELRLFDRFTRLLIGHVVFSLPYVIVCVGASMRVYEEDVEEAARSLGANAAQVLWHVTLPLIRPGIFAGAVFAFVISFRNFTVSFFLYSGAMKPIPVWIYEVIQLGHSPLVAALSVFLVLLTLVLIVLVERAIGLRRVIGPQT